MSSSVLGDGVWLSRVASNPRSQFGGATRRETIEWDLVPQYEEREVLVFVCIYAMVDVTQGLRAVFDPVH